VAQLAVRRSPVPESATALQPPIDAAPSRKSTVPVGALPATVAVSVTLGVLFARRTATASVSDLVRYE
jgi:hypothetical protein